MSNIQYDGTTHTYILDGERVRSVTEIASAVCGKNTDYLAHNVAAQVAAARGTDIHTELANYYDPQYKDEVELSETAQAIAGYLDKTPDLLPEVIVYNTERGYAGTADIVAIVGTTVKKIIDFKSMDKPDKKYCQIQLSLYKLALEHMGYNCSDTKLEVICPKGIIKHTALTWDEIQDMIPALLDIDACGGEVKIMIERWDEKLAALKPYADEYADMQKEYKAVMVDLLESAKATKYIGKNFTTSYVGESTRVSLDTEKLKAEFPEAYEACKKESKVAGFVKISETK